jgi:2-hydroxychromene-2-carboxylate isomerase
MNGCKLERETAPISAIAGDRSMPILARWYFDIVSPYAYLQLADLNQLPSTVSIEPRPVLLGALLKETGIKAPAAVPAKRLHLYRQCAWLARARGIPFVMPPRHPFSSLAALRLLCSLGPTMDHVRLAFAFVFGEGHDPSTADALEQLGERLGIQATQTAASDDANKEKLRENTDEALALGVWGVPTFMVHGQLFWGTDSFPMMLDFLGDPQLFDTPQMQRLDDLPSAGV